MPHSVFFSVIAALCFCIIIAGLYRRTNLITNTSIEFNFIGAKRPEKPKSINQVMPPTAETVEKTNKRKVHIPKFMLELYEEGKREDHGINVSKPDVVRSVIPKRGGTLQNKNIFHGFKENHLLIFDIPSSNEDETFFDAELRILTIIDIDINFVVGVERSISLYTYNEAQSKVYPLDERHVYHTDNTWLKFNLTKPVNRLLKRSKIQRYLKLVISIKTVLPFLKNSNNHFKLSLLPVSGVLEHDYPILLLSYMSIKKTIQLNGTFKRQKRNIEDDYEEESNKLWDNDQQNKAQTRKMKRLRNTCKRKPLYVDFSEIQYDTWIVQPSGYEAFQCSGKCFYPVADHLSPTKHAIVQTLLHSVSPAKVARPCCVPSKLGSISLLYIDEKGVLTYRYGYTDMVVAECGCR